LIPSENAVRRIAIAPPAIVKTILICETQPVVVAGVKALLNGHPELRIVDWTEFLENAHDILREAPVDLVVLDKAFGMRAIGEWMTSLKTTLIDAPGIVVWGVPISPQEATRLLQAGVRGILLKTAELSSLVGCLRAVALGGIWMAECILNERGEDYPRSTLTAREKEILVLVQRGLTNREIARELDICTGTVKIHMKHIFEKTGVRGRHSLALASLMADAPSQPVKNHSAAG
jgi:DNA-binding NarL/FixJ family response regulator